MKQKLLSIVLALFCVSTAMANSLSGSTWKTIDDKTGKPRAEIRFEEENGVLNARILSALEEPHEMGLCEKCPGDFKNKPIKGLQFIWGLKQHSQNNWEGGKLLDPKTGKIYHLKLMLKGDKLYVRGYIGVSLIGRTQIWERMS